MVKKFFVYCTRRFLSVSDASLRYLLQSQNCINVISHPVAYRIPCPETSYAVSSVRPNCMSMPLQLVLFWFPDGILWAAQVTGFSLCKFPKTTYHAVFFLYFVTSEMGRSDLCLFVFCEVETSFVVSFNLDPFFNISPLFSFSFVSFVHSSWCPSDRRRRRGLETAEVDACYRDPLSRAGWVAS